ncbi:MAG: phosphoribosylanthranilate isomerase [Arcticibacterium sp.]|jgi:phosphoribosylanthranilate isomerase
MLKRKVLVTGISNLSEARYCSGMFVDYLCFELNEHHKDYIPKEKVLEIKNWLSGPKIGGRIENWPTHLTAEDWQELGLDFLIITDAQKYAQAREIVSEMFYEVNTTDNFDAPDKYDHILIHRDSLPETFIGHPSIFAGHNIAGGDLPSLLMNENFKGIRLKGSHETSTGESTYGDLMDVLEGLEEDY